MRTTARIAGGTALAVLLLGLLAITAAFTFSVRVSGTSMTPTLQPGDRLLLDVLHRHDVRRFDLVEATLGNGTHVVKRVIGLPGDRVEVLRVDGGRPVVRLRPAGTDTTYEVRNPAWDGQVGDRTQPCCGDDGTASDQPGPVTVPADSYWVLGDNWGGSDDSRVFGFVGAELVSGRLNVRLRPFADAGTVGTDARLVPLS